MDEILDRFWCEEVEPRLQEKLLELEGFFQVNWQELSRQMAGKLQEVIGNCIELQRTGKIRKLGYLVPTLLRTSLLEHDYTYSVYAYDKWLYLKDGKPVGDLSVDWIYQRYAKLCLELKKKEGYCFGKIREPQIEAVLGRTILYFHDYMTKLLRGSMRYLIKKDTFQGLDMEDELVLATGELWEKLSMVYKTRSVPYDVFELRGDIDDKKDMEFACFRNFPLEKVSFSGMLLGYVDFTDSLLVETDFSNSNLQGTRFVNCNLKGSQFLHTKLCEADFTNADLEGANLIGAYANVGLEEEGAWNGAGKLPISFDGANLRYANLSNAYFFGVDFRNADIEGAIFKGTVLRNCHFTKEQEEQVKNSEARMEGVES